MECTEHIIEKYRHKVNGKALKVARAEKGWTITKLAVESGITRKTIGQIEKGNKKKIRKDTIDQLAKTLGKPIDFFCTQVEIN